MLGLSNHPKSKKFPNSHQNGGGGLGRVGGEGLWDPTSSPSREPDPQKGFFWGWNTRGFFWHQGADKLSRKMADGGKLPQIPQIHPKTAGVEGAEAS